MVSSSDIKRLFSEKNLHLWYVCLLSYRHAVEGALSHVVVRLIVRLYVTGTELATPSDINRRSSYTPVELRVIVQRATLWR